MNTSCTITEVFCSPEHPLNKIVTTAMGELGRNRYKVIEPMTVDKCSDLHAKYRESFGDNATFCEAYNLSTHEFVLIRTISEYMIMCKPTGAETMIRNTEAHLKDLIQRISSPSRQTERDDLLMLIELGFKTWGMMGQMEQMKLTVTHFINDIQQSYGDTYEGRTNHTGFHGDDTYQAINNLKHLIGTEDKLQTYNYTCTNQVLWANFGGGTVQAYNIAHATQLAKEKLRRDITEINGILSSSSCEYLFSIDFKPIHVELAS